MPGWPACVDGELVPLEEAVVPVTDEGLLRGDGAFEVVRVYAGRPFALDEHLERMVGSAANLRLPGVEPAVLRADAARLLEAAGPVDASLRLLVTRGGRRIVLLEALPALAPSVALASVTYAPTRILDGVKSLSYAPNMLAKRIAVERGAQDALLVTPHGRVLEGSTSAFFYVRDGRLLTPPLDDHILDSITRRHVMAVTEAEERVTARDDLRDASEAFLASTLREVHPVGAIDGQALPAVPGPVTQAAARAMREHVERSLA